MWSAIGTRSSTGDQIETGAQAMSPAEELRAGRVTALTSRELLHAALTDDAAASELAEPLRHLLATTGKQLRSAVVLHSAQVGPQPGHPSVRTGAVAIELFHLATLVHDDIVDDGLIRRGTPTVGAVYGDPSSGFVGGALFARAAELVATC